LDFFSRFKNNLKIAIKGMERKKRIGIMAGIVVTAGGTLLANVFGAIDVRGIAGCVASAVCWVMVIQIPLWAVLAAAVLLPVSYAVRRKMRHLTEEKHKMPDWFQFTKMVYRGHLIEWSYTEKGAPRNFWELCINCKCQLDSKGECPRCEARRDPIKDGLNNNEFEVNMERVVVSHIYDGTYREIMAKYK